jgi:hypothetical protein
LVVPYVAALFPGEGARLFFGFRWHFHLQDRIPADGLPSGPGEISSFTGRLFVRERQQGHMPGPLYRHRQGALMPGAGAGLAPGPDLAAFQDILPQHIGLFVINDLYLIRTELADARLAHVPATPASGAGWASAAGVFFG